MLDQTNLPKLNGALNWKRGDGAADSWVPVSAGAVRSCWCVPHRFAQETALCSRVMLPRHLWVPRPRSLHPGSTPFSSRSMRPLFLTLSLQLLVPKSKIKLVNVLTDECFPISCSLCVLLRLKLHNLVRILEVVCFYGFLHLAQDK
jgi:hypothetical protein